MRSKKNIMYGALALFLTVILVVAFSGNNKTNSNSEYFRIHIVANSNSTLDQNVKYVIRDKVSEFLIPHLVNINNKGDAVSKLKDLSKQIEELVNRELARNGFKYIACVEIVNQRFPARNYLDFVLDEGFYDAIKINIGDAKGDNWWCVVYPPLCFIGTDNGTSNIVYKSKLIEIVNDFRNKKR